MTDVPLGDVSIRSSRQRVRQKHNYRWPKSKTSAAIAGPVIDSTSATPRQGRIAQGFAFSGHGARFRHLNLLLPLTDLPACWTGVVVSCGATRYTCLAPLILSYEGATKAKSTTKWYVVISGDVHARLSARLTCTGTSAAIWESILVNFCVPFQEGCQARTRGSTELSPESRRSRGLYRSLIGLLSAKSYPQLLFSSFVLDPSHQRHCCRCRHHPHKLISCRGVGSWRHTLLTSAVRDAFV